MLAPVFLLTAVGFAPAPRLAAHTGVVASRVGSAAIMAAPLVPGDTIAVVGASGNVGKLVALRLAEQFKVRGIVREASRVRDFLPPEVELVEADLRSADAIAPALEGAQGLVICTGTTAFPTKAWSQTGRDDIALPGLKALLGAGFDVQAAIKQLSEDGYNTPQVIDEEGNLRILAAWERAMGSKRKRLLLLSSQGVQRREEMPFPILNACGVLSAKAAAEAAIIADAARGGYTYTFVRPGQLFGGPYDNNVYLGTLFKLDKDADTREVLVGRGDVTLNDDPQLGTLRSTLAEVIAQALESGEALDLDFTVLNAKGEFPDAAVLRERLASL
jgi:nucleoside-diphosphate-sugar epimerase